jgi:hypothetical protein
VSSAFSLVGAMLKTEEGRQSLASKFNVCNGADALNSFDKGKAFTDALMSIFPLQSNDPLCTSEGIFLFF